MALPPHHYVMWLGAAQLRMAPFGYQGLAEIVTAERFKQYSGRNLQGAHQYRRGVAEYVLDYICECSVLLR